VKPIEMLNPLVRDLPPSGIRKFFDVVQTMPDAISLGVGEPDFTTPWCMCEAGIWALEHGDTHYTSNWGKLELRRAISQYMSQRFGLNYDPTCEILVTIGASEGIDLSLRAMLSPGDEVLLPSPSYVSYEPCVKLAGGVPVAIPASPEDNFIITPQALESAITPRTRVVLLAFPNNPTGTIMARRELEELAEVIKAHDLIVISDEIYAELTYSDERHVSIASLPDMRDRTIVLSGFSKSFAMTGWRLGYMCGHGDVLRGICKIHQYTIMCAPGVAQAAAYEGLVHNMNNGYADVESMRRAYNRRRRVIVKAFNDMGLRCFEPKGAFYAYPNISSTGLSSEEFCARLLEQQKVAVVPGTAFGSAGEGYVRASYAASMENINEAMRRIKAFLQSNGYIK